MDWLNYYNTMNIPQLPSPSSSSFMPWGKPLQQTPSTLPSNPQPNAWEMPKQQAQQSRNVMYMPPPGYRKF